MSERENLFNVIRDFKTAMMVSLKTSNAMHVRPMAVAEIDSNGGLYFATRLKSPKVSEIELHPSVLVTFQDGQKFAALEGRATISQDKALIDRLWSETWLTWFPDGKNDPSLCLIKVDPVSGEYWDNAGLRGLKYVFESVKAIATGTTPSSTSDQHGNVSL